ncbi:MAG: O-antigen ligase family protein, partial [Desulfobacterales bacterium]
MQTNKIDSIIFFGIVLLLIFAPLAFGSVHVWAYSIIEFGVFLLVAIWFANQLIFSRSRALSWVKTPVNLILAMFFVLVGLQLLPLPAWLAGLASPQLVADKTRLFDIMAKATDTSSGWPSWMILSYSFHLTLKEWLKWGAYFGMFFLVLNTSTSKQRIDILVYTLIFIGLFEAVYAIFEVFNITPRVLWWKSRVGGSRFASGTFIGSNHFATYMEMVFCLSFGYFIAQKKYIREVPSGLGTNRTVLKTFVSWFEPESIRPKMIFFFFATVLMGVALLMSASRGGILALGVSMLLMSALFAFRRPYRKYSGVSLVLCLVTLGYGIHLGIDPTLKKFENPANFYGRLHITRTIIPMVGDYPVIGVGLGNFRYIYPRYIDDFDRVSSSGYAHNDWVEAGTETGFPGLILLLLAFGVYVVKMIRIWHVRRNFYSVGIGAGVLAGLLAVGMHGYFDFSMHIPANPLTLAALLAIGYAALHR